MTALHVEACRAEREPCDEYPVQGRYVERFWLPVLGPTSLLLLRLLDETLTASGDEPVRSPLEEVAAMLGVNVHRVRASIERLDKYAGLYVVEAHAVAHVLVPTHLPRAVPRDRWPVRLEAVHDVAAGIFAEPLNSDDEPSMERA